MHVVLPGDLMHHFPPVSSPTMWGTEVSHRSALWAHATQGRHLCSLWPFLPTSWQLQWQDGANHPYFL